MKVIRACAAWTILLACRVAAISFESKKLTQVPVKEILASSDTDVYLQNNWLSSFDTGLCDLAPRVRLLQLSRNSLAGLNVSSCRSLVELYAFRNKLVSVDVSGLAELVTADLSHNVLSQPPHGLYLAPLLQYLNLAHNNLVNLPSNAVYENLQLATLDLSHNSIAAIEEGTFDASKSLERVYLDHNEIAALPQHVFDYCPQLKVVSLSNNKLAQLDYLLFNYNHELLWLDVSRNRLQELTLVQDMPKLVVLDASHNQLTNISLPQTPRARRVDLSFNRMEEIDDSIVDSKLAVPLYVDASFNNVSRVDVKSFDLRTKTLLLDGNPQLCNGTNLVDPSVMAADMALRSQRMCV